MEFKKPVPSHCGNVEKLKGGAGEHFSVGEDCEVLGIDPKE